MTRPAILSPARGAGALTDPDGGSRRSRAFRKAIGTAAAVCVAIPLLAVAAPAAAAPGAAAPGTAAGAAQAQTGQAAQPADAAPPAYGAPDSIAADYYAALLRHTRWVNTVWDPAINAYQLKDFNFGVVLGNAVLLTHGEYDEQLAGISKEELRQKTLSTITRYAASNRLVNPAGNWGKQLFWDSTFQSYFLDAGKLLWDQLDAQTQANLTTIATGQSAYTADLAYGNDPLSGSWTADWPTGKYLGDTAQEESGVYTQALAPGLAWAPENPDAARWSQQLNDWGRNAAGQPTADLNNPAVVAGAPVSSNTMHTIHDTYIVENHGSFGPHYQSDIWRSGGRNAIQFILNDQPLPEILTHQPNSAELWESVKMVMSAQGEPFMPMVNDREYLYGRDVLPMAFLGQVQRDPDAVRAEAGLASALEDYQAYEPVYRLAKFSGEPKYEPEARAEIGISYLLHVEAAESADGVVQPTPEDEFFQHLSGVRDFGAVPGLTVQQSSDAWAAASSHDGFVKFPWVPSHDSWLFNISGSNPYLYPKTSAKVDDRVTTTYTGPRDGFEGTASVFRIGDGYAGQATLPTGAAVYASTGAGSDDGSVTVRNLNLNGYDGLDGTRTYTTAEGEVTSAPLPVVRPADPLDAKAARVDTLTFDPVTARYIRMQGQQGNAKFGYSLFSFHVYGSDPLVTSDLAAGKPAQASSEDTANGRGASKVTDADASSRWAVSTADRTRTDSWIQVDLGQEQTVSAARLAWEASAGDRYLVQTSTDGQTWTTQKAYTGGADVNVARTDTVELTPPGSEVAAPVEARYVRMQGVEGAPTYGYSLYHFRALSPEGVDLAARKPATASSEDTGKPASAVTDGDGNTRWAVSRDDRLRADSWIQVDLGDAVDVSKVQLGWEASAGREYRIQTSLDGETWQDAASFRYVGDRITSSTGKWLNVEGEAGFVVRDTDAPILVSTEKANEHKVRLADKAAGPFLIEMVPGDAAATAAQQAAPQPTTAAEGVQVSSIDGYLTAFNLTGAAVTATIDLPYSGDSVPLFEGTQRLEENSSSLDLAIPAGSAVVLTPRASVPTAEARSGTLTATVDDARTVELSSTAPASVELTNLQNQAVRTVPLDGAARNGAATVTFAGTAPYPVRDLALSTLTFPASVLPAGMTSPELAVDGDAATSWTPGAGGRMVTDLGSAKEIGTVTTVWDGRNTPAATVSVSDDGITFRDVAPLAAGSAFGSVPVGQTARYVALSTEWQDGQAGLVALSVLPPGESGGVRPAVDRIDGEDRYAVSAAASRDAFPDGSKVVYVASGEVFPDALSAAPAAAVSDAPILLTQAGTLPDSVRAELDRLNPERIVIVGGASTVSLEVEKALSAFGTVSRLQGADRFESSRIVARDAFPGTAPMAVLATGTTFPDALSAGAAIGDQGPVILVDGAAGELDAATQQLLRDLGVTSIVIAGGENSVSPGILASANAIAPTERLAGADRYESSRAIDAHFFDRADRVLIATGEKFPDALSGSALAPRIGAPLFTVPGTCIPAETLQQIRDLGADRVTLLGGPNTLAPEVESLTPCAVG